MRQWRKYQLYGTAIMKIIRYTYEIHMTPSEEISDTYEAKVID